MAATLPPGTITRPFSGLGGLGALSGLSSGGRLLVTSGTNLHPGQCCVVANEFVGHAGMEARKGFAMTLDPQMVLTGLPAFEADETIGVGSDFSFRFIGCPQGRLDTAKRLASEIDANLAELAGWNKVEVEGRRGGDIEVWRPTCIKDGPASWFARRAHDDIAAFGARCVCGRSVAEPKMVCASRSRNLHGRVCDPDGRCGQREAIKMARRLLKTPVRFCEAEDKAAIRRGFDPERVSPCVAGGEKCE